MLDHPWVVCSVVDVVVVSVLVVLVVAAAAGGGDSWLVGSPTSPGRCRHRAIVVVIERMCNNDHV